MLTAQANEYYVQVGDYATRQQAKAALRQLPNSTQNVSSVIIADSQIGDPSKPLGVFVPVDLAGRLRSSIGLKTSNIIALEDITGIIE